MTIPRIRVLEGSSAKLHIELAADRGITLDAPAGYWKRVEPAPATSESSDPKAPLRWTLEAPANAVATVMASASVRAELPVTVASRLWIRSRQIGDGKVFSAAWYRLDSRSTELYFALPPGSRCERAWAGGETVTTLEMPADSTESAPRYRLPLPPATTTGPYLVGIEYRSSIGNRRSLAAPRLLRGAVVERTYWQVSTPRSVSVLGVPAGWSDENQWRWSGFGFSRSSALSDADLAEWTASSASRIRSLASSGEPAGAGVQSFVFSRYGEPGELGLSISRRWLLVGLASTVTLGLGLLALIFRPQPRWTAATLAAAALVFTAAVEPNLAIALAQAGTLGIVLTPLAFAVQWTLERSRLDLRPSRRRIDTPRIAAGVGVAAGGSIVGADDSTHIRPRRLDRRKTRDR